MLKSFKYGILTCFFVLQGLVRCVHLKLIMTAQERHNANLAMVNAIMRKQNAQLQAREGDHKKKVEELERDLAAARVAREDAENEVAAQLEQMKMLAVDTILHHY